MKFYYSEVAKNRELFKKLKVKRFFVDQSNRVDLSEAIKLAKELGDAEILITSCSVEFMRKFFKFHNLDFKSFKFLVEDYMKVAESGRKYVVPIVKEGYSLDVKSVAIDPKTAWKKDWLFTKDVSYIGLNIDLLFMIHKYPWEAVTTSLYHQHAKHGFLDVFIDNKIVQFRLNHKKCDIHEHTELWDRIEKRINESLHVAKVDQRLRAEINLKAFMALEDYLTENKPVRDPEFQPTFFG